MVIILMWQLFSCVREKNQSAFADGFDRLDDYEYWCTLDFSQAGIWAYINKPLLRVKDPCFQDWRYRSLFASVIHALGKDQTLMYIFFLCNQ